MYLILEMSFLFQEHLTLWNFKRKKFFKKAVDRSEGIGIEATSRFEGELELEGLGKRDEKSS